MAVSTTRHALPRDRRVYVLDEPTYGTLVQAAATDAIKILGGGIESHNIDRIEIDDNRGSRSLEGHITGAIAPVPWSYETYLTPSGTAGTPPDIHQLIAKAMGGDASPGYVTTGSSDTYILTDTQGELGQLSIHEAMGRVGATTGLGFIVSEALSGCWVEGMTIKGTAGEPPKITFTGMGSKYIMTGRGALTSSPAGVDNFTASAADVANLRVGSLIGIYAAADGVTVVDDNSAAGFVVSAISGTTVTSTGNTFTATSGDIFAPLALATTTVGNPLPGIVGSLKLATISVPVTAWEVTLANGLIPHADEAFQQNNTGYHEDKRRVTGQITFRARADQLYLFGQRTDLGTHALEIIVGSVAGDICTITAPTVEYGFASIEKGGDVALVTLPFKSLGTGTELKIVFT